MSEYLDALRETARQSLHAAPAYNGLEPERIIAACMQSAIGLHSCAREHGMPAATYAELMSAVAIVTTEEITVALREQQLTPSAN